MLSRIRVITAVALASLAAFPQAASSAPAAPADAFVDSVGVNTHVMYTKTPYWDLEGMRSALRYLGVRHIRDGVRWYTTPGYAWYREEQSKRYASLARSGIGLNLLMPWPTGEVGTTRQALDVIGDLPGVVSVEAANEWDLQGRSATWPEEIRAQTRETRAAMKADPKLRRTPFIAPSFGRFASPITAGDLSAHVDLGNSHPYMGGSRPEIGEFPGQWSIQRHIDTLRAVSGAKPFVITETGYHTAINQPDRQKPVGAEAGAAYLLRTLLEHFRLGATRSYAYELVDQYDDPALDGQESNFGLFRNDWSPKPAATSVRNLLSVLRSGRALRGQSLDATVTGGDANLRTMAFAKSGGGFTLAIWRPEPLWNHTTKQPIAVPDVPMTVTFGKTFAGAQVYRPTRGSGAFQTTGATTGMQVAVGADPVLIDLRPTAGDRFNAQVREWWCRAVPSTCPK